MRHTRSQSRSWADNAIVGYWPLPTTRHLTKPRCSAPAAEFRAQGGGGNVAFVRYRRIGSRGPASSLLYDPDLIRDPMAWLTDRLGKVAVNTSRSRSHHPAPRPAPGASGASRCGRAVGMRIQHLLGTAGQYGSSCHPNQSWLRLLQYAFDLANADPVHVCRLVSRHPVFYPTPEPR